MRKRKNPLNGRVWRELREDLGKYLVIFFLMIFSIGLVSGFLVADNSMLIAYREGFEKYNIEDGNFTSERKLNLNTKQQIESLGLSLYDLFIRKRRRMKERPFAFLRIGIRWIRSASWKERCRRSVERLPLTECLRTTTSFPSETVSAVRAKAGS